MSTARAAALPVGARRRAGADRGRRLISLADDEASPTSARASSSAQGRGSGTSVKTPLTPSVSQLEHARRVVHRVDGRLEAQRLGRRDARRLRHPRVLESDGPAAACAGGSRCRSRRAAWCASLAGGAANSSIARRWKQTTTASSSSRRACARRCRRAAASARPSRRSARGRARALRRATGRGCRVRRGRGSTSSAFLHVELDVVGAQLDRPLEGRQRVLGQLGRGAAVRDHEHSSVSMQRPGRSRDELVAPARAAPRRASASRRRRARLLPSPRRRRRRCPRRRAALRARRRAAPRRAGSPRDAACRAGRGRRDDDAQEVREPGWPSTTGSISAR